MSMVDADKVSDVIREATEKFILPRYKALAAHEISSKTSPRDLVTQADLDVEDFLMKTLPAMRPGSIVIGEESASKDPTILDKLLNTDLELWVVDPVDGTYNFVHGKREFGVMLALIKNGETAQSWIYDVLGEEMTVAEKSAGAFSNGKKLQVKKVDGPKQMSGHINPGFFPKQYRDHMRATVAQFGECRSMACAAHEYLRVARGDTQFSIYSRLKPWDHLAGALTVQESGGYVAKWDGQPYAAKHRDTGLIVSSDFESWSSVFKAFIEPHAK